jgi:hypothetical protein
VIGRDAEFRRGILFCGLPGEASGTQTARRLSFGLAHANWRGGLVSGRAPGVTRHGGRLVIRRLVRRRGDPSCGGQTAPLQQTLQWRVGALCEPRRVREKAGGVLSARPAGRTRRVGSLRAPQNAGIKAKARSATREWSPTYVERGNRMKAARPKMFRCRLSRSTCRLRAFGGPGLNARSSTGQVYRGITISASNSRGRIRERSNPIRMEILS